MKSRNVFTVLLAVWLFLLNMLPALAATEMEKKQKELDKAQHNVQVAEENKDKAKLKVAAAKESLGEIVAKLSRLQAGHPAGQVHHEGTRRKGASCATPVLSHHDET